MSLNFMPLYWIYHDGWKYKESKSYTVPAQNGESVTVDKSKTFNHPGHIHFFMPDMPMDAQSTLAYDGEQIYQFKITDTWGPNSTDPNQAQNIKLIGQPIWYFYIEEYWRRVYIQPWENVEKNLTLLDDIQYTVNGNGNYTYIDENDRTHIFTDGDIRIINDKKYVDLSYDDVGKIGIKYDASKPEHSFGPFREGGKFYFFNTVLNRTMPIEYWKDNSKHVRDYFVKDGEKSETSGNQTWTFASKDQLFNYVYDSHYIHDTWSYYYTSYSIGRFRDIYAPTRYNHYRYFFGTNAKRLKKDLDNKIINHIKNEEKDGSHYGWQEQGWTGWFEYSGVSITNSPDKDPRENIIYCDPANSYSYGTHGRYYVEKDESKKIPHEANYYKRVYKPVGYDIQNQSTWTPNIRKHFPSPPPYLNPADREDLVQLYWEYLIYYDKVCYYVNSGNQTVMNFEPGRWETYLLDYAIKRRNMPKDRTDFQTYLSFEDYQSCFQSFCSENSNYFFQYEITASPGTSDFFEQLRRKNNGRNPQDNSEIRNTQNNVVSNACEMYVSFEEFCNEIWTPLNADEIKLLKLNGDYPSLIRDLPTGVLPAEEEVSSSSSDTEFSAFDRLSPENTLDFTKRGKSTPDEIWKSYFDKKEIYTIPEDTMVKGDYSYGSDKDNYQYVHPREASFSIEDGARWNYPDSKYVYPVIEYQKIIHCNYERLPNKRSEEPYLQKNWDKDKTGDWGDGFEINITIPFKKNDEVQSPFSGKDKITKPVGEYFHDVIADENKMRYHVEWYDSLLQLRKYDFPTYVTLMQEFKSIYPDYNETFAEENSEIEKYHSSSRKYIDENNVENERPWSDFLIPFWNEKDALHNFSNTPVIKRDDEGKFDETTGVYRDKVTQNCITIDQVSTVTLEDGSTAYGYRDSKGNIIKGGNVVEFNNPYPEHTDGKWVEQCLGAIVKPRVLLILEDPLGYRWQEWVEATALTTDQPLKGNGL